MATKEDMFEALGRVVHAAQSLERTLIGWLVQLEHRRGKGTDKPVTEWIGNAFMDKWKGISTGRTGLLGKLIDDLHSHAAVDNELHDILETANEVRTRTIHRTIFERVEFNASEPDAAERALIIEQANEAHDVIVEATNELARSMERKYGAD